MSCRRLVKKAEDFNKRFQTENKFLSILKRNIQETKDRIETIEQSRMSLRDRSKQINQCLDEKDRLMIRRTLIDKKDRCRQSIRRLCSLIENIQRQSQIKLDKVQLILRLAELCRRLESPNECFLTIDEQDRLEIAKTQVSSSIINELCCYSDNSFPYLDHLKVLWMKIARVQYDIHLLVQQKRQQKSEQYLLRKKLNYFI